MASTPSARPRRRMVRASAPSRSTRSSAARSTRSRDRVVRAGPVVIPARWHVRWRPATGAETADRLVGLSSTTSRQAAELVTWYDEWHTILEWDVPFARWFVGGTLNVSYNCLDRHVEAGRGERVAYHWEGEPGDSRTITYADLLGEVERFANVLKRLGIGKGDRVAIYMPMIPELPVAMLACARIGAPHSVEHVVVVRRVTGHAAAGDASFDMPEGRDQWYHALMSKADAECPPVP